MNIKTLPVIRVLTDIKFKGNELVRVYENISPVKQRDDGTYYVSAEDGSGIADYYGEFRGGYPWIDPELEQWATDNGCYWEWQDAGTLTLAN